MTFGVNGGREAAEKVMDALQLAQKVVHVADVRTGVLHPAADVRTGVLHPASMTHRQLNEADQVSAGILPELIRVSVGIEAVDDIITDFSQALGAL